MATTEDIARDLLASMATDEGFLTAIRWIDNRYKQLVSRVRFRHLRNLGELSVPARYDTGTVSVSRGSTSVTGSLTAWVTNIGSGSQEYYYFRASSAWYKIASIGGEAALTLATAFAEDDVSAGTYVIVKKHHPLNSSARWLGDFLHTRLRTLLDGPVPLEQLDRAAPGRTLTGSYPLQVTQVGIDSNNVLIVEVYPYPDESEIIHYVYWSIPTALSIATTIPAQIDPYILKEGALIDLNRYLMAKALKEGKIDVAGFHRNEARAQETRWERLMQEAARTDRGADDIGFILTALGGRIRTGDIRTARDIVLDRWTWPA